MEKELHILRHALGLWDNGSGRMYRNYYAADGREKTCEELVKKGDMCCSGSPVWAGGLIYYYVTAQGKQRVIAAQPKNPPLTRSQQRYRRFLDADCGVRFGEWMKTEAAR